MNPRIIRSRSAEEDLEEIWDYIARDSAFHAERFIRYIDERLQYLAANPLIGRPRSELGADLRGFLVKHLVIFYRTRQDGIEIVRILHSSRDIGPEMFP
jgi:toxin ParE1/3/4